MKTNLWHLSCTSNQDDSSATLTTQHVDRNQSELLTDMIETTNGTENEAQQIVPENHDLANLLKSWNLFDELYKFLTSQELTTEQLKYMKIRHLDTIFADQKINSKIIFEQKLSEWQNEQGIYYIRTRLEAEDAKQPCHNKEHLGEDNANAIAISSDAPSVELNVGNILKQTGQGKSLLNSYAKNKMLSPEARTFIVHTVIQFLIDSGRNLTVSQCKNFAEQIVCVFPTECIETYFAQTDKKLPPKGKLFDRYRSRKRKLAAELNQSPKRQRVQSLPEKEQQSSTISNSQELAEICMHLKHIRDWKEIVPKWSQTIAYRKQQFQNPEITLQQILKDWPLFKYFRAPDLVDIDYNHCHSYKILNFVKWDKFCTIAEDILRPRIKDAASKALLRQVIKRRNSLNIDNLSISYMMLLHSILPPPANVVNGCHIKYTIADSQNSFTVPVVNHLAHVNDLIKKKREQCLKGKTALLQPFIIVVGDEFQYETFYVVLDDTKFLFSTYMEAIEYCFKLMNVLNLKYPNECFYVWIFIQKFLFDISKGTNFPLVNTLINDINVLISKP